MKYTTSVLLASVCWASALKQQCSGIASNEGGNWFCGAVDQIIYQGIKGSGKFQAVTHMGPTGDCKFEDKLYSGPLAPLNEDLSIHIRGPISVKEVAVYSLSSKSKRHVEPEVEVEAEVETSPRVAAHAGHGHGHGHKHLHRAQRSRRDMVFANIDGKEVSWENNWFGGDAPPPKPPAAAALQTPPVKAAAGAALGVSGSIEFGSSDKPNSKGKGKGKPVPPGSDWARIGYYSAEKQIVENMTFMANYGGSGSGVFDTTWGSSLAYLNAEGDGGASSPQILRDTQIPSNKEFAIFSGEKCDESCGFVRAKDVAYKGFAGPNKAFLFKFKMPLDGLRGFNEDMPAIWALNARIPRTAQYNGCSCWKTGCGEVDICEVLASGDTKCKSTLHLANGAGSSDYFTRPIDEYIKLAAVFHEETASVSINKLPDDVEFAEGLDEATVQGWLSQPSDTKNLKLSSLFQIS